jgi:hypothetical protein
VFEDHRVRNERHDGEAMFLCLRTDQNVATHVVLFHVVYFYVLKEPCCEFFVMFSEWTFVSIRRRCVAIEWIRYGCFFRLLGPMTVYETS